MKHQQRTYWCGPAALQNALRIYGKKVSQKRIADLAGTTENGTTQYGLMAAIEALGFRYEEMRYNESNTAGLNIEICEAPVLACVENWEHWVTISTINTSRFIYIDPARTKANLAEHLVHIVTWQTLERRWRAAAKVQTDPTDCTYYGIVVLPP